VLGSYHPPGLADFFALCNCLFSCSVFLGIFEENPTIGAWKIEDLPTSTCLFSVMCFRAKFHPINQDKALNFFCQYNQILYIYYVY